MSLVRLLLSSGPLLLSILTGCLALPALFGVDSDILEMAAGSDLSLRCRGRQPLSWDITGLWERQLNKMSDIVSSRDGPDFISELKLRNASVKATANYTCRYDTLTAVSVYVFVEDPIQLLVPHPRGGKLVALTLRESHGPQCLPCLPTHPKAHVELWRGPLVMPFAPVHDVAFDPKRGFCFPAVSHRYEGVFHCNVSLGSRWEGQQFIVNFLQGTAFDPVVRVDTGQAEWVVVNGTFSLDCSVEVDIDVAVEVRWSYPSHLQGRVTEGSDRLLLQYPLRQVSRELVVAGASPGDEGPYECKAMDHDNKVGSASVNISIHEFPDGVELLTDGSAVRARAGGSVVLAARVLGEARLAWTREPSLPLDDRASPSRDGPSATLTLRNLRREDSGVYTLHARTDSGVHSNISFDLLIEDKPRLNLGGVPKSKFYRKGEAYTVDCNVDSVPPATHVEWIWQPCFSETNCSSVSPWEVVGSLEEAALNSSSSGDNWRLRSSRSVDGVDDNGASVQPDQNTTLRLQVTANVSGLYTCRAINALGTSARLVKFYVTETGKGLEALGPAAPLLEGDSATLHCLASRLLYTGGGWLSHNGTGVYNISSRTTQYSYIWAWHIDALQLADRGRYFCQGDLRDPAGVSDTATLDLEVQELEAPSLEQSEWAEHVNVEAGTPRKLLVCRVRGGRPSPALAWFRDGQLLEGRTNETLELLQPITPGRYHCVARNGVDSAELWTTVDVAPASVHQGGKIHVAVFIMFGMLSIALFAAVSFCAMRHVRLLKREKYEVEFTNKMLFEGGQESLINPELPLDEQAELLKYHSVWEFPKERLKLGRTVGYGAFGRVVRATAVGILPSEEITTVAVKMLKERADKDQLRALATELKILSNLGHHVNIVNLLGAVTKNVHRGELLVIVEFCCHGNLRHYLLRHRDKFDCQQPLSSPLRRPSRDSSVFDFSGDCATGTGGTREAGRQLSSASSGFSEDTQLSVGDLLAFSFQCARGMEYLASRRLIHRDLAARNVLLAENNVVKICDFGLAKNCYKTDNYVKKGDGPLPIKWMAIESIRDKVFTSKSDVWSFGVLMWEIFTMGGSPYPGLEVDEDFYRRLLQGHRMERPALAPGPVYDIMWECWLGEPADRPDFTTLATRLGDFLEDEVRQFYVDLSSETPVFTNNEYLQMAGSARTYANLPYDRVGALRPVDASAPAPSQPLEVIPMIQLDTPPGEADYLCMSPPSPSSK